MKKSKLIRDGNLCKWHGDKLVRMLNGKGKLTGVWMDGHVQGILKEDGSYEEVNIPTGLQIYGRRTVGAQK